MLMPSIVALAIVVALVRGGSLQQLASIKLRWIPLVIASLSLQLLIFTPIRATPLLTVATQPLYFCSLALLVIWVALNWRIPGMALMATGLLCNFLAIVANGGYMPASPEALRFAGKLGNFEQGSIVENNSIATTEQVRLWLLTDIFALPSWLPLANVISIGDILITAGAAWLCYRTMTKASPAETPTIVTDQREQLS